MEKIKIGVFGAGRGRTMLGFSREYPDTELVAVCDKDEFKRERVKLEINDDSVALYSDFDEFLKHDMDAVVLANYANEHAPFAIRCMEAGKHVFSEVLPFQNMKEAVELIECIERTGKVYAYGENYCYMPAPYEMKKLYKEGKIGEFEYGEGEYVHNCEPIWPEIAYGEEDHWRNNGYSTFYCTHSLGPIVHITGLRPVKVTGFEGCMNERRLRVGCKSSSVGLLIVEFENGAIYKSLHGDLYKNNIWYSVYGSKGRMETARESAREGDVHRIYVDFDEYSGAYDTEKHEDYRPTHAEAEMAKGYGHGNSDFYSMYNFVRKIQGFEDADIIDVYEACDMFLPGIFAYRSILQDNVKLEIPDMRDPAVREQYRNDTACTDPKGAGDQLLPTTSKGTPEISQEVYDSQKEKWEIFKEKKLSELKNKK